MKRVPVILGIIFCAILASVYIYPIFSGLILLPLDLLVSDSGPWHWASTILLKNSFMKDSILQMFPWKHLTFTSLSSGILPLWNPYQFMGMPFMAGMKPLVFYPANLLFIFGETTAWNTLLWLQLFLSSGFTYLLAGSLGLGVAFSLFAAVAFAFNSLMMGVLQFGSEGHVLLWLPLLLYLIKRFSDTRKLGFCLSISLVIATIIFAGHLQYAAYVIAMSIAFAFTQTPRETRFVFMRSIVLAIFLGFGIGAIQLIPGVELFRASYRGATDSYAVFSPGLLRPFHLLRLLSPDWFGNPVTHDLRGGYIEASGYFGIIPLFFALYAAVVERKNRYVKFFTWTAVLSLLFSMNGIAQILYALRLPIITSGYGSRLFSLFLFGGAMLAGFGLKAFLEHNDRFRMRAFTSYLGSVAILFLLGFAAARWGAPYALQFSNAKIQIVSMVLFGVAGFGYFFFKQKIRFAKVLFMLIVLVLVYGDLFRMGYRFLTFSNTKFLYPDLSVNTFVRSETNKSLGRTYGLSEPELETIIGIYSTETYNPLYPLRTAKLLQALEGKSGETLADNEYYLSQGTRMKYALDFLGVSIVAVGTGKNPALEYWNSPKYEKDITKIYSYEGNDLYRNVTAYPRFGLYFDIRDEVNDGEALSAIEHQSVDFTRTLLIKEHLGHEYTSGSGSAQLLSSGLNTLSFRVTSDKPAVFYISDTYFPGWHVSINGAKARLLHANYNFRAVEVPAGDSEVLFWYLPTSFLIGAAISAISIAVSVIMLMAMPVWKDRGR